jgi:phosphopantothenoylcysteine synthetase/decarboxylase
MLETKPQRMLYLVVCGAPPASHIGEFISQAQHEGWEIGIIATPAATKFMNIPDLEAQTGHPIRVEYRMPGESDPLPEPDAIVVAPATFNTLNKWALGIADTLAVGILCEYLGRGVPIVAVPCLKQDLARHPAFPKSRNILKKLGVQILFEPNKYRSPEVVPWEMVVQEITVLESSTPDVRSQARTSRTLRQDVKPSKRRG